MVKDFSCKQSMVTDILNMNYGLTISNSAISYWINQDKKLAIMVSRFDPSSPVQVLVHHLRTTKGIKSLLLYHDNPKITLASGMGFDATDRQSLTLETHFSDHSQALQQTVEFPDDSSIQNYASRTRSAQGIKDGEYFLLVVAWIYEKEKCLFDLFPQVLMSDITNGTNSEKRPFCMVLGCDRDNKYPMFLKCFMPSVQRWIFEWFYHTAMYMLLG